VAGPSLNRLACLREWQKHFRSWHLKRFCSDLSQGNRVSMPFVIGSSVISTVAFLRVTPGPKLAARSFGLTIAAVLGTFGSRNRASTGKSSNGSSAFRLSRRTPDTARCRITVARRRQRWPVATRPPRPRGWPCARQYPLQCDRTGMASRYQSGLPQASFRFPRRDQSLRQRHSRPNSDGAARAPGRAAWPYRPVGQRCIVIHHRTGLCPGRRVVRGLGDMSQS
jgi:hypothetical protein